MKHSNFTCSCPPMEGGVKMDYRHDPLLGEKIKMIHRFGNCVTMMHRLSGVAPGKLKARIQHGYDAYNEFCRRYPYLR